MGLVLLAEDGDASHGRVRGRGSWWTRVVQSWCPVEGAALAFGVRGFWRRQCFGKCGIVSVSRFLWRVSKLCRLNDGCDVCGGVLGSFPAMACWLVLCGRKHLEVERGEFLSKQFSYPGEERDEKGAVLRTISFFRSRVRLCFQSFRCTSEIPRENVFFDVFFATTCKTVFVSLWSKLQEIFLQNL